MVFYSLDDRHVVDLLQQGLKHVQESVARPSRKAAERREGRSR
jgi:hypothetical protein